MTTKITDESNSLGKKNAKGLLTGFEGRFFFSIT